MTAEYSNFFNQDETLPNRFNPDLQTMKCSFQPTHTVHFLLPIVLFLQSQLHWQLQLNTSNGLICGFPHNTKRAEVIKFPALLVIGSQIQYWITVIGNRDLKKKEYFELNRYNRIF